ncbi:hypothetical protein F511_38654 [Dorcoceras hygrometricum]|uniref:Uncharacterized protein n=1 Tax=Dorcoceras hygrometricum TaxID=472368 RepID=A0A2Z7AXT8_9LAMI|nr:hypothetical protein F511_38654 [Dorcoceras hygrometricum]
MGCPGQARTKPRRKLRHRIAAHGRGRSARLWRNKLHHGLLAIVRPVCNNCAASAQLQVTPSCGVNGRYARQARSGGYLVQNDSFAHQQWEIAISPLLSFRKSHSLESSSYAQHIELSFHLPNVVKRLATSRHDPLGITDSACKNQLVVVSVQYGPFNTYIPIRSTTIDNIGYPRMRASGESSTTKHRLLHASGSHPIPPPNDPKTNQYNQDLGLIHSTNGNHLESPNEGSSIDHQVTIHLHAQNITMFATNETMVFRITDASLKLGRPYPHFDGPID